MLFLIKSTRVWFTLFYRFGGRGLNFSLDHNLVGTTELNPQKASEEIGFWFGVCHNYEPDKPLSALLSLKEVAVQIITWIYSIFKIKIICEANIYLMTWSRSCLFVCVCGKRILRQGSLTKWKASESSVSISSSDLCRRYRCLKNLNRRCYSCSHSKPKKPVPVLPKVSVYSCCRCGGVMSINSHCEFARRWC